MYLKSEAYYIYNYFAENERISYLQETFLSSHFLHNSLSSVILIFLLLIDILQI